MSAMMFAKDSMHSPIIMINDHHYHDNDSDDVRQGLLALAYQHHDHAGMMITIMATTVMLLMKFANNHVHSQISNNEEANPLELGARG